jgi:hypothetical protein
MLSPGIKILGYIDQDRKPNHWLFVPDLIDLIQSGVLGVPRIEPSGCHASWNYCGVSSEFGNFAAPQYGLVCGSLTRPRLPTCD